jgi:putative effector of murein hydrolase
MASYLTGRAIQKVFRGSSLANPVLIAILLVAGFLNITGTSYQT